MPNTDIFDDEQLYPVKQILKNKKPSLRKIAVIISLLIGALIISALVSSIYKIDSIEVIGSSKYSSDDITSVCGISYGDSIFYINKDKVSKNIFVSFPFITDIKITKEYPNKVKIEVTESQPTYYTEQNGIYILVSDKLRVMDVSDSAVWGDGLIRLRLPSIKRALEGYEIEFKENANYSYITEFLEALSYYTGEKKADEIVLSESFSIKMVCDGTFTVDFGKGEELEIKMKTLTSVMRSNTLDGADGAKIDVSNPKEPRAIPQYIGQ